MATILPDLGNILHKHCLHIRTFFAPLTKIVQNISKTHRIYQGGGEGRGGGAKFGSEEGLTNQRF